jgi:hypothetical protein
MLKDIGELIGLRTQLRIGVILHLAAFCQPANRHLIPAKIRGVTIHRFVGDIQPLPFRQSVVHPFEFG